MTLKSRRKIEQYILENNYDNKADYLYKDEEIRNFLEEFYEIYREFVQSDMRFDKTMEKEMLLKLSKYTKQELGENSKLYSSIINKIKKIENDNVKCDETYELYNIILLLKNTDEILGEG